MFTSQDQLEGTITEGLTLNTSVIVSGAVSDPEYTSTTFVEHSSISAFADNPETTDVDETVKAATVYKLEIPAANVLANKGKTRTFTYTAKLNEKAVVLEKEHNKAHITYDNFTTVDVDTDVTTLAIDVQKVDGTDQTTILAGAKFKLYDAESSGNEIKVVALNPATTTVNGVVVNMYRVAMEGETGVEMEGGTFRIEGLDNKTYYLEETTAPTGYNKRTARISAETTTTTAPATTSTTEGEGESATTTTTVHIDYKVENNKGTTLPSTGGIGTTIFYVVGSVLVIAAGVLLVTKKRMGRD